MNAATLKEKIEMILIYGECRRNVRNAVALYAERFPDNVRRSQSFFYKVVNTFMSHGSVQPKKRKRRNTVTGEPNEIAVLAAVQENPHVSTRQLHRESGISRTSIIRILRRHKYHPYHISLHQELHGDDFRLRVEFCQWAVQQKRMNPNFFANVLFSDESTFTNHGAVNRHNMHYWSAQNPHWLRQVEHQRPWSVNVWCGIIGNKLIGPYFIDGTLNGIKYRDFLEDELPPLLEDVALPLRQIMWFQQDGCPAHYSVIAREVLNRDFNGRWIGRGGPINFPARSPDLTSPDFFLWGYLKEKVYDQIPTTREDMIQRIRNACAAIPPDMLLSCVQSFELRIEKCLEVQGEHFEHLI